MMCFFRIFNWRVLLWSLWVVVRWRKAPEETPRVLDGSQPRRRHGEGKRAEAKL
jgi:hypothetical protein